MAKKLLCVLLAALMLVCMFGCTKGGEVEENLDYTYGLQETFHSNEPVTYTMYFSDASWYPMVETWESEGVFQRLRS